MKDGAWYPDTDGPNNGEFKTHMPASGAAIRRDGTLLLFEIDGRQPALSIGVLQTQFAALMIAFGAQPGMQFDGGGDSTIVARLPATDTIGIAEFAVRRRGAARRRWIVRLQRRARRACRAPVRDAQTVRALPHAHVPVRIAVTDASGHPASACECTPSMRVIPGNAGAMDGDTFVAGAMPRDAVIRVQAGALRMDVPVHVTTAVARAEILPQDPALLAHQQIALQARAFDAHGYPIAIPQQLAWNAANATIDSAGSLRVGSSDTTVSVRLGSPLATQRVTVGEHAAGIACRSRRLLQPPPRAAGIAR